MINELTFPEEIRPDQALAALRIGFLFRRAEHESATIWKGSLLKIPDIEETFEELDGDLLALSNRFNDYEARKVSELRNQMANASSAAFHIRMDLLFTTPPHLRDQMRQQIENDPAVQGLKKLQISRLDDLRGILLNIVGNDLRLSAWFEIGNNLGHAIFRFMRGELSLPLSPLECAELSSGVRKLAVRSSLTTIRGVFESSPSPTSTSKIRRSLTSAEQERIDDGTQTTCKTKHHCRRAAGSMSSWPRSTRRPARNSR